MHNMTEGREMRAIVRFALPMIAGNLFQQLYNVVDSVIAGRFIGPGALAAIGASFAVMGFLISIQLGLCMGAGVVFAHAFGAGRMDRLKVSVYTAFWLIGGLTLAVNLLALALLTPLLGWVNIPPELMEDTRRYLTIVLAGMTLTFLYNFFAAVLRAVGNSLVPLLFLALAALTNVALDLVFIVGCGWGVAGAALATVVAQALSAVLIALYSFRTLDVLRGGFRGIRPERGLVREIVSCSVLSSVQQSIMNLGILMVQGLVNSFGVSVMAAFAAAVKIDAFAYMPVQDFGNAFSTYIAQNHGAGRRDRIDRGVKSSVKLVTLFCLGVSALVVLCARPLMQVFIDASETLILDIGCQYLTIEAAFYCLIGYLFLLYGLYRGLGQVSMSIVLTVISLGTRVALAYGLSGIPQVGLVGIWWAVPIGWLLADAVGFGVYLRQRRRPWVGHP